MDQPTVPNQTPIFKTRIPIAKPVLPQIDELAPELNNILRSGILSKGTILRAFENEIAAHLGVKHAVATSSCTTGLMLTYQACGLSGDVVVPSFTFMATVSALSWAGLRPIFADVDARTTNLDPESAEAAITPETQAIVAVHNSGNPAEIETLERLARKHGLCLIFDSAHGFGSLYQGQPLGAQGDAQVFSLSATKLLVAAEGGIVATNDDAIAERVRIGREFGNCGDYDSVVPGINARMTELSALLGRHSLRSLEASAHHRNHLAALYRSKLGALPGISFQQVNQGNRSSFKDFSVMIDADAFGLTRDQLSEALAKENIETRKYYDPPVHRQRAYQKFARLAQPLPNTDLLAQSILSLPLWSDMDAAIVTGVCEAIEEAFESVAVSGRQNQAALV